MKFAILFLRLANENLGWDYTKIRDALRGLKMEIGRTTVANILVQAGFEPAPERIKKRTWAAFIKSHWSTLYACDFFSVETLGTFGTVRHMVFFVIELKTRIVHIAGIRVDPDEAWMVQIARNLCDPTDGFLRCAKFLVHDRDPLFTKHWKLLLATSGITSVAIPAKALIATLTLSASSSPSAASASITSSCLVKPTCDILFANKSPTTTPNAIIKVSVANIWPKMSLASTTTTLPR